ncbi:hypothetical protein Moror_17101 [Moniliophthora roreri MCA 2997]|uniref:Transmembrane protein n=1 Tax=Moniliophthora roreri (strain MCA 2997) TaxID=1381753 RepID=V2WPQ7_MONRO|nr:hypothetical protein Moror_17101 [Moniliophthora roreri MCA 2997]
MSTSEKPHEPPTKSALEFDPGLTTRRKQSGFRFICKFILWIFAALISVVILFFIFNIGRGFVNSTIRFAHTSVYQNETWQEAVANGKQNAVVRPLIDEEQSFDVAVTVWLRSTEDELESRAELDNGSLESLTEGDSAPNPEKEDAQEHIIYDGIVFRGLRLRDKNVRAEVPLQVPTHVFRSENISTSDLRASIVLMPSSPSLLDYVTNYSSWYPTLMRRPPVLSPSTLSSPDNLQGLALETFGISVDLVKLHKDKAANDSHATESNNDSITEEFWDIQDSEETGGCYARSATGDIVRAKSSHKLHPYVISRTQIRVSDETHVFNRAAFVKRHRAIKERACGLRPGVPESTPNVALCNRNYTSHGNWETIFQLRVPSSAVEGEYETQWAYAPYLSGLASAPGPKDFIRVPVTRHVCDQDATSAASKFRENVDPNTMNITWYLSFSGRTPNKLATGERFLLRNEPFPESNVTERQKQLAHERSELINGLFGHPYYPDAHPRRKLVIVSIRTIGTILTSILRFAYWSTRKTSVHLTIHGTWLMALSLMLSSLFRLYMQLKKLSAAAATITVLITALFEWAVPILMVRTVLPLDLLWSGVNKMPFIRKLSFLFRPANHRERTSARLDSRANRHNILLLLPALVLLCYIIDPYNSYIIPPTLPLRTDSDNSNTSILILTNPLWWTAMICQIALNFCSGIFAGSYRLTAFVQVIDHLLFILSISPLMGRSDSMWGCSLVDAVNIALVAVTAWQAAWLPRHKPELDVDDEDSR